jgi:ABC-type multidrug transport system fused ATPase/permease subunit
MSRQREGQERKVIGLRQVVAEALRVLGPDSRKLWVLSGMAFVQSTLETMLLYLVARLALALTVNATFVQVSVGPLGSHRMQRGEVLATCVVLLIALFILSVPLARYTAHLSVLALIRARTRLAEAWFRSAYSFRVDQREGHLMAILGDYTQRVERLVQQVAAAAVAATSLLVMAIGTVVIAPLAALVAGSGLLTLGLAMRPFSRSVRRASKRWADHVRMFSSSIAQSVRLSQEIVAFDVTTPVESELRDEIVASSHALGNARFKIALAPTLYQYGALGVVLAAIGMLLAVNASGNVAAAAPVILLMVRALTYAKQMQVSIQTGNEMSPYVDAMDEEIAQLLAHPTPGGSATPAGLGRVEVEAVSFAYPNHAEVLHDLSFVLESGQAVGVIGPSGGGKSTLVQLLLRLRTPTGGRILFAGEDLQSLDGEALARLAAFVPQDNKLIRATVLDNIRFFRSGFTDEEVVAAARAAHVHDDILALPDGYETMIGTGARDVSGGQRQRLGIARALLGHPQLLILDEPTSALDARSEQLIRDTLLEMRGRTTIVAVAHRPATLEICDRVLRVDEGTITEVDWQRPEGLPAEAWRREA